MSEIKKKKKNIYTFDIILPNLPVHATLYASNKHNNVNQINV